MQLSNTKDIHYNNQSKNQAKSLSNASNQLTVTRMDHTVEMDPDFYKGGQNEVVVSK